MKVECPSQREIDSTLLKKVPAELREQLVVAYLTCRQAVQQQLAPFEQSESALSRNPASSNGNGERPSRPATQSQQQRDLPRRLIRNVESRPTAEHVREIRANLAGFFTVLREWREKEKARPPPISRLSAYDASSIGVDAS